MKDAFPQSHYEKNASSINNEIRLPSQLSFQIPAAEILTAMPLKETEKTKEQLKKEMDAAKGKYEKLKREFEALDQQYTELDKQREELQAQYDALVEKAKPTGDLFKRIMAINNQLLPLIDKIGAKGAEEILARQEYFRLKEQYEKAK